MVLMLRPLDYVFASPIKNVQSRLVPTCLDDLFQKREMGPKARALKRDFAFLENVGQKTKLDFRVCRDSFKNCEGFRPLER